LQMIWSYTLKTQKTSQNSYSKLAGYKINLQKSLVFLYTNNEQTEKEFMETIPEYFLTLKC
jgi:hypothetical protein